MPKIYDIKKRQTEKLTHPENVLKPVLTVLACRKHRLTRTARAYGAGL